jgi:uroporphyrin-III C-methyltransferase / precorrin-2 dehydrogenase / sirohydrochlorin ferrochelatase
VPARDAPPDSQAAVGRLDQLAALAAEVGEGPAILVIGEVVARCAPWRAAQSEASPAREAA